MKKYFSICSFVLASVLLIAGCTKVNDLPAYKEGNAVTLTASATEVVAKPSDSLNNVLSFSWTNPNYATDSNNYKFVIEIDSTGRNFSKSVTKEFVGKNSG